MTKRPLLSKGLASRIRGAQDKLQAQIQTHVWAEREIPEIQNKLAAFDADPEGWAAKHYPRHGPDSHPVQTHIMRSREALERKLARRTKELEELAEAQANLRRVEAEVEEQAKRIRPSTIKEQWPKPVSSIEVQAARLKREMDRDAERFRVEREKMDREHAVMEVREAELRAQEDQEAIRRHVAKGPEHVIAHQMTNMFIRDAFEQYKETQEYANAHAGGWSGGLVSFVTSKRAVQAGADGLVRAKMVIAEAKDNREDLWNVCRRYGFWTPEDI